MGLDMYLEADRYLWSQEEGIPLLNTINETLDSPCPEITEENVFDVPHPMNVVFQAGYWRKANAIHKWFVNNVQANVDDCKRYYVSFEQLEQLKELCSEVLQKKSLAPKLLPTESGFFFGSLYYDDYYFQDLEHTIKIIDYAKEHFPSNKYTMYYESSW